MIIETDTQVVREEYIESIERLENYEGDGYELIFYMTSGNILTLTGTEEKINAIYDKIVKRWSEDGDI